MTVTFKVYKKSSANGRLTLYLGRRDFVDHVTGSDPVDGVINIDKEFINDKVISAQLLCSFRYGREVHRKNIEMALAYKATNNKSLQIKRKDKKPSSMPSSLS